MNRQRPPPASLRAPVSPPRKKQRQGTNSESGNQRNTEPELSLAAVEAGRLDVDDPLRVLSSRLLAVTRHQFSLAPRLSHPEWVGLYMRNKHPQGRHFVIHQHDHPIAGPHYDLRLQFSESSSLSFAIMYGLPGNPNSRRMNRNATETRVHNIWSHLIETASINTGSLIIWDTGEYSILPYYQHEEPAETHSSASDAGDASVSCEAVNMCDSDRLKHAFRKRKIRLRLHGARLPPNYTVTLRLTANNNTHKQPKMPKVRRGKRQGKMPAERVTPISRSPSSSPIRDAAVEIATPDGTGGDLSDRGLSHQDTHNEFASYSDDEDERVRVNNAYPGAVNSISSIHQRRWFLSLDRVNSGFKRHFDSSTSKYTWVRQSVEAPNQPSRLLGFEPFFVQGPDVERSVVTGRLGSEVFRDEGVDKFTGRRGWRPVLL
ncbi:hypothetical protein LOZ12_002004 [Ophidiomyces ophidiicola]|uniref:Uncharacterized protein n=1 Tax=Ophidiomyces ophidiicola TaxID=1387563 RepID=A0ACB8UZI5_9EURO|nr:hypothetical protein LOZ64_002457 [Ophidiomyces ophidiicola]KAI1952205.1 hypothetical protein LOZ62_001518 [Ophidiomyces ophidiicola]KAI1960584.1 hypothetical protein LOZ59_002658 [Ophidiomyces ophidiicola]KAI1973327.1 hypothetical protein LOZ56_001946 [Ophidiomyces ophidiicola]KAI2010118.1 hypothetical protein LOZ50_001275 [Ophidiomyces ophidiicola]